jgi:hypothetical protein
VGEKDRSTSSQGLAGPSKLVGERANNTNSEKSEEEKNQQRGGKATTHEQIHLPNKS